jgi:hypothetical protein
LTDRYYGANVSKILGPPSEVKARLIHTRDGFCFLKECKQSPDGFVKLAKNNPKAAEKIIMSFISKEKTRAESEGITPATIGNCLKAI